MPNIALQAARLGVAAKLLLPVAAMASQGPGIADGTASHFTQVPMALLVYGGSAVVVVIGLIGAVRNQIAQPGRQ